MKYKKNEYIVQNGSKRVFGEVYWPETEAKVPFVIFSHGFNGRYNDFRETCEYLAEKGIGSYGFDFCGGSVNSRSSLKTTEMTIFTEKEDLAAVLNHFLQSERIDSDNIFLFGGSQGGFVSALVAEEYRDKIKAMLLLFPAFCIPDDWKAKFPETTQIPETQEFWGFPLGRGYIESIRNFKLFDNIGGFDKDVVIFHGDQDDVVNISFGEKAATIYKKSEIVVFPGEGHGFSPEGTRQLTHKTAEFIQKIRNPQKYTRE